MASCQTFCAGADRAVDCSVSDDRTRCIKSCLDCWSPDEGPLCFCPTIFRRSKLRPGNNTQHHPVTDPSSGSNEGVDSGTTFIILSVVLAFVVLVGCVGGYFVKAYIRRKRNAATNKARLKGSMAARAKSAYSVKSFGLLDAIFDGREETVSESGSTTSTLKGESSDMANISTPNWNSETSSDTGTTATGSQRKTSSASKKGSSASEHRSSKQLNKAKKSVG